MSVKLYAGMFKGRQNERPLEWWIGIGEEKNDPDMNSWVSPSEARKLAQKILKLCDKIKAEGSPNRFPSRVAAVFADHRR